MKEITNGLGKNALGKQGESLQSTVNYVMARSGKLNESGVIITSAISKLKPVKPGK